MTNAQRFLEQLEEAITQLMQGLCDNDLPSIETATQRLEAILQTRPPLGDEEMDTETLNRVRALLEAVQCLVWTRLMSLCGQSVLPMNVMIQETV